MSKLISVTGKMLYEPFRANMSNKWWATLRISDDMVRLYQYFILKEKHIELCQPSWNAHVSVVRGETPSVNGMQYWKKYQNKKFTIQHELEPKWENDTKQDGLFCFVKAYSPELDEIRNELGLPIHPHFHITIGRTYYQVYP